MICSPHQASTFQQYLSDVPNLREESQLLATKETEMALHDAASVEALNERCAKLKVRVERKRRRQQALLKEQLRQQILKQQAARAAQSELGFEALSPQHQPTPLPTLPDLCPIGEKGPEEGKDLKETSLADAAVDLSKEKDDSDEDKNDWNWVLEKPDLERTDEKPAEKKKSQKYEMIALTVNVVEIMPESGSGVSRREEWYLEHALQSVDIQFGMIHS